MNVDERIAELTRKMLRRKFYAVLSQPSKTPEKLKALLPASVTTAPKEEPEPAAERKSDELNVEAVFAKLKQIGGKGE